MDVDAVPAALRERFGAEATGGLLQLLDQAQREGRADVIAACTERFERRVVDEVVAVRVQLAHVEVSLRQEFGKMDGGLRQDVGRMEAGLRQDMAKMETGLRQDMGKMEAGLRQDMAKMETGLRQDMGKMEAGLRQDMGKMEAGLRQDMAAGRVELLKWCFLFWIGQVVAITGILGVMLRLFRL